MYHFCGPVQLKDSMKFPALPDNVFPKFLNASVDGHVVLTSVEQVHSLVATLGKVNTTITKSKIIPSRLSIIKEPPENVFPVN